MQSVSPGGQYQAREGPMEARKREDGIEIAFNMSSPSWNRDREKGG